MVPSLGLIGRLPPCSRRPDTGCTPISGYRSRHQPAPGLWTPITSPFRSTLSARTTQTITSLAVHTQYGPPRPGTQMQGGRYPDTGEGAGIWRPGPVSRGRGCCRYLEAGGRYPDPGGLPDMWMPGGEGRRPNKIWGPGPKSGDIFSCAFIDIKCLVAQLVQCGIGKLAVGGSNQRLGFLFCFLLGDTK